MALPGDDIIAQPNAVMDRAFTLDATPAEVWPWFMQLGKNRAGWYFPRWVERFVPRRKRGLWRIENSLQDHKVGDVIDDWGGKDGYLEVAQLEAPKTLVYKSTRGKLSMSWAITLWPEAEKTRVIIRLRLTSPKNHWFLHTFGELLDKLTIAGLARGLGQRLAAQKPPTL